MLMSSPLQKNYNNISQRILSGLMIAFSDFAPIESEVPVDAQKEFYDIMKNILLAMYRNPEKIGLTVSKDDYFKAFTCGNQRPDFDKMLKEIRVCINDFFRLLCFAGKIGTIKENSLTIDVKAIKSVKIKIKKEYTTFLHSIGIPTSVTKEHIIFILENKILRAWQLLAKVTLQKDIYDKSDYGKPVSFGVLKFACALFSNDFNYYQNNIELIHGLPIGYFTPYINDLKKHGFYEDISGDLFNINFSIMGKTSGFAIQFHDRFDEQFYFMAYNCQGVKAMLADFNNLSTPIQNYLVFSCRKCNSCMGCTKGGKSKKFTMNVNHNGQNVSLCPQFNRREWFANDVNDQFMVNLIEYIKLQEKYGKIK